MHCYGPSPLAEGATVHEPGQKAISTGNNRPVAKVNEDEKPWPDGHSAETTRYG